MTEMLTGATVRKWIEKTAAVMAENRTYLTELDKAIGDADHGNNMDRGFKAVVEKLPEGDDIGALLKAVSMALISKVGGAAGPLYGTMFLQGSKPLMGKSEISFEELAQFFEDAVAGVKMRGKAEAGEKTMLDALVPAAEAFRKAGDLDAGLKAAVEAAEQGMKDTIPMIAKKGRASYLGERSRDHQDPGATSSYMIVKALEDAVSEAA
ncbi:dihydroxyacetone kinase DhaL subunit [Breoghania corrubedonensis]|uniref:Dihydroxyacetone kinase DhaL subunit n=1 Tax=Breoghania corrubedonensis TaxID=665038 RepID=A0A2T5UNZ8_9HYPH|nr:dihydroxyacetone kinase subunit DhaL [Breoghania corrubedonensis]PTW53227.1 dihydroxyacetone kinase DhaL subunit [Breoghania corrubedonensis]